MTPTVFISYSHKDEQEKEALLAHLGVLQRAGKITLWNDDQIGAGEDWKRAIEQAIAQAKIAILLVTVNFLNSNFILEEEVPALLERRRKEGLIVLPVIAKACAWRRVDWLAEINVRPKNGQPIWAENGRHVDENLAALAEEVARIMEKGVELSNSQLGPRFTSQPFLPDVPEERQEDIQEGGQSLSFALVMDLEPPHGTMPPDSKFYIGRAADDDCWNYLSQTQAATLFVQAPRQMGKSSLMRRMLFQAEERLQRRYAFIDFQKFPEEYFLDEESFLIEFCLMISEALAIPERVDDYWRGRRTAIIKCSRYLSEYIIPHVGEPFILAVDEVDRMLNSSLRNNFFGMMRTWHNDRGVDPNWARMTIFLSSSTEPYLFIDNPSQSPFNIAELILLEDFGLPEVMDLNRRHYSPLSQSQISSLMDLVGGHPYLIRRALYLLATNRIDLKTLLAHATEDSGPFREHLSHYLRWILGREELKIALAYICHHHRHEEDQTFHRLKGAGLVKRVDRQVVLRNNLYDRYFKERLSGQ